MYGNEPASQASIRLKFAMELIANSYAIRFYYPSETDEKELDETIRMAFYTADKAIRYDRETCKTRLHGQPPVSLEQAEINPEDR